jgi:uncharacterized protein
MLPAALSAWGRQTAPVRNAAMEVRRSDAASGPLVTGFVGQGFRLRVGEGEHASPGGILLTPAAVDEWNPPRIEHLAVEDITPVLVLDRAPEFLLLGTGSGLLQPPRSFIREIEARGFGVEVMDSRAAARAWSVLRAEDRWIVAALMPL